MTRSVSAVILLALCTQATADDLPSIDAAAFCNTTRGGARNCLKAEAAARETLAVRWAEFPLQRKHFCVQSVTFRPKSQRSYVGLAECLADPAKTSSLKTSLRANGLSTG